MPHDLTGADGNLQWRDGYDAWGSSRQAGTANFSCELIHQPLRFQGQYFDHETGLHYNRHRHYDPDIGRFLTQDPIGLRGSINMYQYAPNPWAWIDPLGLVGIDLSFLGDAGARADGLWASQIDYGPNYFLVDAHGDEAGQVLGRTGVPITPSQMADEIRGTPTYRNGQTVYLFACYSARGGNESFAQKLADQIGAPVMASDGQVNPGYSASGVARAMTNGVLQRFTPSHL